MDSLTLTPQPTLSHELKAIINERKILHSSSRARILTALDVQIEENRKNHRMILRQKAIEEIYTSELSYLHQLEIILKFFKEPLLSSNLLSIATGRLLFGNIESIYQVNGELVNQLRIKDRNVGAAFLYMAPFFKVYSMYAYGFKTALNLLEQLCEQRPKLKQWIKSQERRPEVSTSLSALLIAPIQRLPRYRMLLMQLQSLTPRCHEQYSTLSEALREVEKATRHIDNLVCDQENHARLVKLQQCLGQAKPCLVGPNKRLIKEGSLMKMTGNGDKAELRYFILLNDSIIYCKFRNKNKEKPSGGNLQCCCVLPICQCKVHPVLGEAVFKITWLSNTFLLFSEDRAYAQEWIKSIQQTINEFHENVKTLKKSSSRPLHYSRKRKYQRDSNVKTAKEDEEVPRKRRGYCQNVEIEDAPTSFIFSYIRSMFQSLGDSIRQYVYPRW